MMKRKLLLLFSVVAAIMLAFAFGKATAEASELKTITTHTADGLGEVTTETHDYRPVSDLSSLNATDYVYLTGDLNLSAQFIPAADQVLYLDLNGHTLKGTPNSRAIMFNGAANAKIVLSNGTLDLEGTAKGMWGPGAYLNGAGEVLILDNVTVKNSIVNNTNGFGGAITLSNAASTLHVFDSTFTECTGNGGPAISINVGSAYFHSGAIKKCSTTSRGGACFVNNGSLYLLGGVIGGSEEDKCTSTNQGSAVLVRGSGYLLLDGTEISYNEHGFAGQVCAQEGATFEMKSGLITKGKAATNNYGGNVALFQASVFRMSGGTISDGSVVPQNNNTYGGNIAIRDDGGTFEMTGGTISGGFGADHGGNIAAVHTGAIIRIGQDEGKTTIIKDGRPLRYGGNIQTVGSLTMTGGTISGGIAGTNGGNIAFTANDITFTMSGGTIEGGYVPAFGGNITFNNAGAIVNLSGGTITGGSTDGCGGNINFQTTATVNISDTAKITEGKAGTYGGNFRMTGGTVVTMTGGEISNGQAGLLNNIDKGGHGGNFTLTGDLVMSGGTIKDGESLISRSGNFYLEGSLQMSGGTISGGKAATNAGSFTLGGSKTSFIKGDALIEGGYAESYGGTFVLDTAQTLTISGNAKILGGSVGEAKYNDKGSVIGGYAGSIYSSGTIVMDENALISGGVSNTYAGNISISGSGSLTMNGNSAIKGGKAYTNGGNITITGEGSLTLNDDARIEGGEAESSHGGNIALNGAGSITINDGYVLNGKSVDGANIYCINGSLTVNGGQITGGVITKEGAENVDIAISKGCTPSITDGYIGSVIEMTPNTKAGFITGGHFIECPNPAFAGVDGKTFIQGKVEAKKHNNPDTTDTNDYYFQLEDESQGILIDADTEVTGLSGLAMNVTGTGYYNSGAAFSLKAPEDERFTFLGWFDGDTKLTDEYTYAGTASAAKVYTAKYSYTDASGNVVILKINVPFAYSYKVGSNAAVNAIGETTVPVDRGTEVTLNYGGSKELFAWLNPSKKILSDTASYKFTVFANTEVLGEEKLEVEAGSSFSILFLNESEQVLGYKKYTTPITDDEDEFYDTFPAKPNRLGRTTSWDFQDLLDADPDADGDYYDWSEEVNNGRRDYDVITVRLVVQDSASEYTVTVNGCDEAVSITKKVGEPMWFELPAENGAGKKLVEVKDGDTVVSKSASFSYKAVENKTLTAVYADSASVENFIVMTVAKREGSTVYFTACRSIMNGTIAEQGIVFAKTNLGDGLKKGAAGVYASIGKTTNIVDSFNMNLNGVPATASVYARGYVILTDGTEIYTDIAAVE